MLKRVYTGIHMETFWVTIVLILNQEGKNKKETSSFSNGRLGHLNQLSR